MYKVFFNDSIIQICSKIEKFSNSNVPSVVDAETYGFVNQLVSDAELAPKGSRFLILYPEHKPVWDQFKRHFQEIPAAGGLVQNENGSFLFIKRLGVWDLPKGKIEKNETAELAAIREVEEECGLTDLKIVRQLDSTFHIYRSPWLPVPKNLVLKETKWFLMTYSGNEILIPQAEENIEEGRWFAVSELTEVMANTYSSLIDFLEKSLPTI